MYKYRILSCALMASAAQRLGGSTGERVVVGSGSTAGSVLQVTKVGFKISPSSAPYYAVCHKANLVIILARKLPFTASDIK